MIDPHEAPEARQLGEHLVRRVEGLPRAGPDRFGVVRPEQNGGEQRELSVPVLATRGSERAYTAALDLLIEEGEGRHKLPTELEDRVEAEDGETLRRREATDLRHGLSPKSEVCADGFFCRPFLSRGPAGGSGSITMPPAASASSGISIHPCLPL